MKSCTVTLSTVLYQNRLDIYHTTISAVLIGGDSGKNSWKQFAELGQAVTMKIQPCGRIRVMADQNSTSSGAFVPRDINAESISRILHIRRDSPSSRTYVHQIVNDPSAAVPTLDCSPGPLAMKQRCVWTRLAACLEFAASLAFQVGLVARILLVAAPSLALSFLP